MDASPAPSPDLLPPGSRITLENCDREPIATPGGIQPHGALIAVQLSTGKIVQMSANAPDRLGWPESLLGSALADVLTEADLQALITRGDPRWGGSADGDTAGLRPRGVQIAGRDFDAFAYRIDADVMVIELEPAGPAASAAALVRDLSTMIAALQSADSSGALLESAAAWVRELTGFDRVWAYRFEADDHGVVVAEERRQDLQPFLGLHFPARDIPPQARALFLANRIRFIPDSFAEPSPLEPLINPVTGEWPDLSAGILRAVSPMHLQYLQNMGTRASMSIALEVEGRLWGLISGHHYAGPRVVEHRLRLACELLGRVVSVQLASLLTREAAERRAAAEAQRDAVLAVLARSDGLAGGLAGAGPSLLALGEADGAAVQVGDVLELIGDAPAETGVRALLETLSGEPDLWVSESLREDRPDLAGALAPAAGAMALTLSQRGGAAIVWFREEYRRSVTWGDAGLSPAKGRLSPSGSYGIWSESVDGHSRPWSEVQQEAARSLRAGIGTVVLDQAEELARANTELARSNADLEAFSFIVAHDLREPLRNIQSFLGFFLEDHAAAIPADGLEQLATVRRLSNRMDALMDSLLEHAKADRLAAAPEPLTVDELVDTTLALLPPDPRAEVEVLSSGARLCADRDAATHILLNLITNALKYSTAAGEHPRVQISVRPLAQTTQGDADPAATAGWLAVAVRDFGIGIAPEHREAIFDLFRRLHARDAYGGGSGAGLAIARRLARRTGGELWLEFSRPGEGAEFCFSVRQG